MVQSAPVNIVVGSHVWVEDPVLAWIDGEDFRINGQEVHVHANNGKTVIANLSKIFPKDTEVPPGGADDMTKLLYLHEPGVLQNLTSRYELNEIYTSTGNILIAINPFQRLPHLYDTHMMEQYKGAAFGELSPHVFAVADAAYRAMINEGKSNSVLVSGESGAGKTETTKMLMRYLAYMGDRSETGGRTVEQQVLESNPVLEAFGDAKNVQNNNSSRFGKFVEIHFDKDGRISGAAVRTYLLKRSRVCQVNDPERNYHCFYLLCAAPSKEIERYKLGNPRSFHYLNQSNCYELGVSDAHEYVVTRRAMDIVGISEHEQEAIFRVVAAVLHLGNVDFSNGKESDSSIIKDEKSRFHLQATAELLMCDAQCLENALIKRIMVTPEEVITRALDPASATVSRDGLAKTIYSRLFDWLVAKINISVGQESNSTSLIGVLDIYGVESFKYNSFEQLCINYTNEKLQQHFNQHVFNMEQEEYMREGINWSYIDFVDNHDVLDLIEKIGKSKVFLRAGQMAQLDDRRTEVKGSAARTIQRQIRMHIAFKEFCLLRQTTIYLQSFCRGRLACKLYENMRCRAAAINIQRNLRRHFTMRLYSTIRSSSIALQTCLRAMTARKEFSFRKQTKAAIAIQAKWRCHAVFAYYKKLQMATLTYQCAWRQQIARRELKRLKMTARETGALKEANDKLEKHVEELTWLLQLEKELRTELEKGKQQEIEKLKEALHEMQLQVDHANSMLIAEKQAAKKAIADASPVILESPVILQDTKKIDSLMAEVEMLKALLLQDKSSTTAALQAYAELEDKNCVLVKKHQDAERKVEQFQDNVLRLEEKLSNLESENQILRRQAFSSLPARSVLHGQPKTIIIQDTQDYGNTEKDENYMALGLSANMSNPKEIESMEKLETLLNKKQYENQNLLIKCISMDLGFSGGRPIAACVIYKCLLHWGSFEMEKSSIFELIIRRIGSSIEIHANNELLSYWLSNSSTLLLLLQQTLKASAAANINSRRQMQSASSLFRRISKVGASFQTIGQASCRDHVTGGLNDFRQVEAKYPALLFKQQLTAFLEKIYGIIRDNIKKEISPLLGLCIQASRTSQGSLVKRSHFQAIDRAAQVLITHWQNIVVVLDRYLHIMRANYVPPFLVSKLFNQIFSFVNVQLFNSLLLRREYCSFSNGEYVKAGLTELDKWCVAATELYAAPAREELKHIRQAVGFLILPQKPKRTLNEITKDVCPELSLQQLHRISTMYWDDKYGTHSLSTDVILSMRVEMAKESSNTISGSFLLDDDSSIPFSMDDISKSISQIDISNIEPPSLMQQNSGFAFLLQPSG